MTGVPQDAGRTATFQEQVADVLYDLYAHGPRGRASAVMLRDYFAPRVAAAIEALRVRDHLGCAPFCEKCQKRALDALRSGDVVDGPAGAAS